MLLTASHHCKIGQVKEPAQYADSLPAMAPKKRERSEEGRSGGKQPSSSRGDAAPVAQQEEEVGITRPPWLWVHDV